MTISPRTTSRSLLQDNVAEVDEPDRVGQLGRVEEEELLLVTKHLQGRLAEHGEVQRGPLRSGIGEHDLMGERRRDH